MLTFLTKFLYNIFCTTCFIGVIFQFLKSLKLFTMNEIVHQYGKRDLLGILIFLYTLNIIPIIKSGISDDLNLEESEVGECINWIVDNILDTFKGGSFLNNAWNSIIEYIMIVIFCKRQFTLNSSFFFGLSLFIKNVHSPWIQDFRDSETLCDEIPLKIEITNLLSVLFFIYLESNLARQHLKHNRRRLANCVVGSEIMSLVLILKGLAVNKCCLLLSSHLNGFKYGQLHCFYLRIVTFFCLSISHTISLVNTGLTKKVIFKFYIFTRIFQSTKETIENFSELNRFRKMTKSLNYSMLSPGKEELESLSDRLCIICRDEITEDNSKKLSCGHIFHIACLQNWMIRQYCCPTCLTPISSKSKNLLHEVEKTKHDLNRAKTNLISLVLGCKRYFTEDSNDRNSQARNFSLPCLEPDLCSLVFSKNRFPQCYSYNNIYEKTGYFQIFEKLYKIRTFILENLIHFSNSEATKNFKPNNSKNNSIFWTKKKLIKTSIDLQKITQIVPDIIS